MTKKNCFMLVLALVLAAVYIIFFTDWFQPKTIQIFHTSRMMRNRFLPAGGMPGLMFGLNHPFKITEIKVVPLAEFETNRNALPSWHLVTATNSAPLKAFFYGQNLRGLKSAVPGMRPQPLATNVLYRLFVEAGSAKGQHDFELK